MPTYELRDNETGSMLSVDGEAAPSPAEIARLFSIYGGNAPLPEPVNDSYDLDLAAEMGKAVVRGFGKGLLSSGAGLAGLANVVTDNIGLEDLIDAGEENEIIRLANQGKKSIDESIGVGDQYRDRWLVKASEGFGSVGSFLVPGGIGGLFGKAGALAGTVGAGVGIGASDQMSRIEEARARGVDVSKGQEDASIISGGIVGSLEAFVPFKVLKKIKFAGAPSGKKAFFEKFSDATVQGIAEGTQEVVNSLLQDAIQKNIVAYDPDIEVGESLFDDFTIGAASGFALDLVANAFVKKRGAITKEAELEREAQFREEEDEQSVNFANQAEQRKSQIEQARRFK